MTETTVFDGRVVPRVTYLELGEAVAFLSAAFGFEEDIDARQLDDAGVLLLTEMRIGDAHILLGRSGNHGQVSPAEIDGRNSAMLIVYVTDARAHLARAEAAGARVVLPLNDAPWGERRYEALDSEGHRWAFHQTLAE
ncbi:MAG: VOC family protein [Pseudomonadota bacterium]